MIEQDKMGEYFNLGVFIIAMILAVISIFSLYGSINNLFGIWLDYKYIPVFQILFNLAILIISIYLIRERLIKK